MANWDAVRQEWENSKITLKALAEKHDVKLGTLKSRKSRESWSRDATNEKVATPNKKMQPKKEEKEPASKSDKLTEKQRLFCIYYIKYFNATKAYQKAYECDYMTANANGSRLLVNASVKLEIKRMKDEQTSELMLDARDVLQKYIDIAFSDITDFVEFGAEERDKRDEFGEAIYDMAGNPQTHLESFVRFKNHYEVDGTIITEVKQGRDGISVKLADKMRALEMLSKYFDLLSDSDKKRLQEEKLRVETEKAKAEAERIKQEQGQVVEDIVIVDAWSDDDD